MAARRQRVFLGLGANLGDRAAALGSAVVRLAETPGVRVVRCSSLYETGPVGPEQPDFLNAAVEVETDLPLVELLAAVKAIEVAAGRADGPRWGPRPLDIDLLLAEEVVDGPGLKVPHAELHRRAFALAPLCELAPEALHPVLGRRLADCLRDVSDQRVRRVGALVPR